MDEKEIKVTGTRSFESGAVRDPNETKGRYDLVSPLFLRRLAIHTQKGGQARGDRNWEAGMPMDAVLDSTIRHCYNYLEGDRSEDHLAAAAWNLMNLIHTEEQIERGNLPADLADGLPDYTEKLPERRGISTSEVIQKLLTYGEVICQPVSPEDFYTVHTHGRWPTKPIEFDGMGNRLPYTTDRPHEHYDCVPSPEVAEKHELERCCHNCAESVNGGPDIHTDSRGPDDCWSCVRCSNWRKE